uniref:Uncharacterized protein n=1 Tax=Glossina palpalis gambiensis TaxID=67801 RepID=A0A1B0BNP9_9MUSC
MAMHLYFKKQLKHLLKFRITNQKFCECMTRNLPRTEQYLLNITKPLPISTFLSPLRFVAIGNVVVIFRVAAAALFIFCVRLQGSKKDTDLPPAACKLGLLAKPQV